MWWSVKYCSTVNPLRKRQSESAVSHQADCLLSCCYPTLRWLCPWQGVPEASAQQHPPAFLFKSRRCPCIALLCEAFFRRYWQPVFSLGYSRLHWHTESVWVRRRPCQQPSGQLLPPLCMSPLRLDYIIRLSSLAHSFPSFYVINLSPLLSSFLSTLTFALYFLSDSNFWL